MRRVLFVSALCLLLPLAGCSKHSQNDFTADILPSPSAAPPILSVHIAETGCVVIMDAETYIAGVVAGEMPSSWPLEALKAQAILARTFVLKFITEKDSKYPGADISTDIAEAQAYNAEAVNARILQAVQETSGLILMTEDGQLPYTWFHSHSGGMTETARDGIDWQGEEPGYTRAANGMETDEAAWKVRFTTEDFIAACRETGAKISTCSEVVISQKGKSGRAVTVTVDGTAVNAARLRISLGSSKMRSTWLTEISVDDETITLAGRGYGHGVGMSQWGAYELAQQGWSAEKIALHYYNGLQVIRAWE